MRGLAARFATGLLVLGAASRAEAGGLYFSDRGVRAMGRGGAFVAGADDLGAIGYNPAGLADARTAILVDFAWLRLDNRYTRELRITDDDGVAQNVRSPTVAGVSPVLPIPTLAGSLALSPRWTMAAAFYAPYVGLATYPVTLEDGSPSPARYTLGSFDGSAVGMVGVWTAYKIHEVLRVGVGVGALAGIFQSTVTFSASPQDRLLGAPEQPEYDAQSRLRAGPIFAPTADAGILVVPDEHLRLGLSAQLPTVVDTPARLDVRLPTSAAFDGAKVSGDRARVHFVLPAVIRAGVEVRPTPSLRLEATYVRELWSAHDNLDVNAQGMTIDNLVGAPGRVAIPPIRIPRSFVDSSSYRLGGEFRFTLGGVDLAARGGVAHETSAVPGPYLSLSSFDLTKTALTLGGSLFVGAEGRLRLDAVYGHVFTPETYVDPREARISRINPLKGNAPPEAVNGGSYRAAADLMGLGLAYRF